MADLARRLDALKIAATSVRAAPARAERPTSTRLQDLGGHEVTGPAGACWQITTPLPPVPASRRLRVATAGGEFDLDPPRAIALDLETGGFSGTPVFLIGAAIVDAEQPRIVQWLARDYPEESAILEQFAALAAPRDTWITFNGKSFDEPFVRDRAVVHRIALRPPAAHLDVLHLARRRWKHETPDCRLATLEEHILGRRRPPDIPGSDVPDLFHHFLATGNAGPLAMVLEHNRLDLLAVLDLLPLLGFGD